MAVLLNRRAVVQAAMESVYNTPATLGLSDGVLVADPMYSADPEVLERDFTRDTLSAQAHIVGRMLAKMEFTTELRGNGKQNSGVVGDAPIIARLFRACGFTMVAHAAANSFGPFEQGDHANAVAFAKGGTLAGVTELIQYVVTVTTGGASGTAQVTVTSDTVGEGSAAGAFTTGTPKTLGTKGLTITPTFTGVLAVGQQWIIWLMPPGIALNPISDGQESITLSMNKDGVRHLMPGAYGTFEIEATAGQFATIKWTFTGTFNNPTDAALVSPVYERTLPAMVEVARLRAGNFAAVVEKFSFTLGNDVQVRPDVNSEQGYIGTRIVARAPEGGIDPEADLVASYDFWAKLRNAARMSFQMRIGRNAGNTVWFLAPSVQYTKMTYADRQGILTYDAGLKFAGYQSDDEVKIYLC